MLQKIQKMFSEVMVIVGPVTHINKNDLKKLTFILKENNSESFTLTQMS